MTRTSSKKNRVFQHSRARKTFPLSYVGLGPEQARAALLEALPDAFLCLDTQWQLTHLNHLAEALLGATREALLGRNIWQVLALPANSELSRKFHEALEKHRSLECTVTLMNKLFAVRIYPFQEGVFAFFHEITVDRPGEERLQIPQGVSEHKAADGQPHIQPRVKIETTKSVIVTNLRGKITYWNAGASALFGYTSEEMLGKTPAVLYPELEQTQLAADLQQIRKGRDYRGLWKGRRKDGSSVWLDITTTLLRSEKGKEIGYIGIAQEASERDRQDTDVEFFYYARIAQSSRDAVIATDTNYTTLSWNETAEKLYGWKAEEVLGKTIDTVLQTVFLDSTREEASQQLRGNGYWKGEVLQLRKDGTRRLILSSVVLIKDGSGKIMGAVAANRDIPALKSSASMIVSDR